MFGARNKVLTCLVVAVAANVALSSAAFAADPNGNKKASPEPSATVIVGIAPRPMPPGFDAGITPEEKRAKKDDLEKFKAAHTPDKNSGGISPNYYAPINIPTGRVSWPRGLHQKTSYYCVVAVIQSMAFWDLGSNYFFYGGASSLAQAQDRIYALIRDPVDAGADDWLGLDWVNQQYRANGYYWRYDAVSAPGYADFIWYIKYDVTAHNKGSYVRVDLSSGWYNWGQSRWRDSQGRVHVPEHATMAIGFNDYTGMFTSYDPFPIMNSDGSCSLSYTSGPDWGCTWQLGQYNYWQAMDRQYTGDPPMWW